MPSWENKGCDTSSSNVGVPSCISDFDVITGEIAVPKGTVIPASILKDEGLLKAYLMEKAIADNPNDRFYFIQPFDGFTGANVDPQTQTATSGRIRYTGTGFFAWDLVMWDNGSCAYKMLLKFHQKQDKFDFINFHGSGSSATLGGVKRTDNVGDVGLGGVKMMQVFTPNWGMANGGNEGTNYMIHFKVGDSEQMRSQYAGKKLSFDLAEVMSGLIDVEITAKHDTGAYYLVDTVVACSGESMTENYSTELILQQLWHFTNKNGNIIPTTSIVKVGDQIRVQFNTASPNYPPNGESIKFDWTVPSNLEGLGVVGYEAIAGYASPSAS